MVLALQTLKISTRQDNDLTMYSLRKSTSADAEFAYDTINTTMRNYALQTWGVWLDEQARQDAREGTHSGSIQIICVGKNRAGTVQWLNTDTEIRLKQLYILPPYQNKGIGGRIIDELKNEANEKVISIVMSVLQINRAKGFYIKKGFSVTDESAERVQMRYKP